MRHGTAQSIKFLLISTGLAAGITAWGAPPSGTPGADHAQAATERSARAFDREAALAERRALHDWLRSEAVADGRASPVRVAIPAAERELIDQAERGGGPERVGLTRALSVAVDFSDLRAAHLQSHPLRRSTGAVSGTADGGYVFTAEVESPEALALRLHFKGFRLPPMASLFLYTDDGQVFGPYTGRGPLGDGEFWSHTVFGERVIVQLRHAGPVTDADLRGTAFRIAGLGHVRPRYLAGACSYNESCVESAACGGLAPAVDDAVDAVAHMQWISGPYIYMCTGGLLADTDSGTEIPYFLSANHCISRARDARSLENFFQLEKDQCSGSTCDDVFDHRDNHPQSLRTLGATLLATGRDQDYTLFRLNQSAPSGSAFLGWNSAPIAFTNNAALFRISHPSGAPQAYSEHVVDTGAATCSGWPRGNRIYSRDTFGATEGGSSGSPVVNAAGQVVGQLSGACGTNVGDVCDDAANATVDGAFAAYFGAVESWLDPDTGGGCQPSAEICGDGIDNDCDGLTDSSDPDCSTGGGGQPGESCEVNSDCASNTCKGKPGSKTCK